MSESLEAAVRNQLGQTLERTHLAGIGERIEGKVRDCYLTGDGRRTLVATDRISAFDVVLGTIPFKGQVLNQMAAYWFEDSAMVAPNHLLDVPDPNVTIAVECEALSVEFVMRAYLTGTTDTSIWRAYERGEREFCGHPLPDGMVKHQALDEPLLTPTTKGDKGQHDVSLSRAALIDAGAISASDFDAAADIAARLFAHGRSRAAERGMILVDTKYEFGRDKDGRLLVIDEIHTPDSSRYWFAEDYADRMSEGLDPRSLDKEFVRRWLVTKRAYRGHGEPPQLPDDIRVEAALRYIETYELITGTTFVPDTSEPQARIASNLGVSA